jgi:hypothetical protein
MAWVYSPTASPGGTANIVSSHNGSGSQIHYLWFSNGRNLSAGHSSPIKEYVTDPQPITPMKWIHYAVTWDNSKRTMILYRDGVQVSASTNAAPAWTGSSVQLSIGAFWGGNMLNGLIDDVRVYNGTLSPDAIRNIYQSTQSTVKPQSPSPAPSFVSMNAPTMAPRSAPTMAARQLFSPSPSFFAPSIPQPASPPFVTLFSPTPSPVGPIVLTSSENTINQAQSPLKNMIMNLQELEETLEGTKDKIEELL